MKFKVGDKVKYISEPCFCGCGLKTNSILYIEHQGDVLSVYQCERIYDLSQFILAVPDINEQKLKEKLGLLDKME